VYAPIKQLDDDANGDDEIVSLIKRTQYSDWRKLRLLDEHSSAYREAVNSLAARLVEISDTLQENPPDLPSAEDLAKELNASEDPGIVDIMADAEVAIPVWVQAMDDLAGLMNELQETVGPMTEKLHENDRKGNGFAGRLALMREFATQMEPIADRLMSVSNRYADQVITINPAVLAAIRELKEGAGTSTPEERTAFINTMSEFANIMRPIMAALDELVENLEKGKGLSRDLAKPINKMTKALSSLRDSHNLMEQWNYPN
ncbi:hypothetical protein JYK22_00690, partial [Nonomuraea sp. RK-328]|nr:hypothetical protein [Nonomuraea sp. RK-328]